MRNNEQSMHNDSFDCFQRRELSSDENIRERRFRVSKFLGNSSSFNDWQFILSHCSQILTTTHVDVGVGVAEFISQSCATKISSCSRRGLGIGRGSAGAKGFDIDLVKPAPDHGAGYFSTYHRLNIV